MKRPCLLYLIISITSYILFTTRNISFSLFFHKNECHVNQSYHCRCFETNIPLQFELKKWYCFTFHIYKYIIYLFVLPYRGRWLDNNGDLYINSLLMSSFKSYFPSYKSSIFSYSFFTRVFLTLRNRINRRNDRFIRITKD